MPDMPGMACSAWVLIQADEERYGRTAIPEVRVFACKPAKAMRHADSAWLERFVRAHDRRYPAVAGYHPARSLGVEPALAQVLGMEE